VKRIIAVCFAGVLIFAGAATAASSPTARIAKLESQVKALTATVKKQQAIINCVVKVNKKCVSAQKEIATLDLGVNIALAYEICLTGVTADAIQSTWTTLDAANHTTLFGPQQTISDADTCSALQISRQGIHAPPSASVFSALTALFTRRLSTVLRLG
jgi:hypothetical protein